jgi:thiol-disulfide isomerase/thioredoxin
MIQLFKIYQTRLLLLLCVFAGSCEPQKTHITVKGDVKNLPDGTMFINEIYPDFNENLDSTNVKNGVFTFKIASDKYPEPPIVRFRHIDNNGVKRFIHFLSRKKHRGQKLYEESFFLEDGIEMNGTLIDTKITGLGEDIRFTSLDRDLKMGPQTMAAFNDTLNFKTIRDINQLKKITKQHPFSYYYLYNLKKMTSRLSNKQFNTIFGEFNTELKQSKTGKGLENYIIKRNQKGLDFKTVLPDTKGILKHVLKKEAKVNMVVLWASWCGPCRQEIPLLKQLYKNFKDKSGFRLVSVSLDKEPAMWHNALKQENMEWEQLIITPEITEYQEDIFKFDGAIPTTLFIDKSGKIIHKLSGYNEKEGLAQIEDIISRQMGL